MNPDDGADAEDWFAKFEREAREAAQKRDGEAPAAPDSGAPAPGAPAPQLPNPFDAPPAAAPPTYVPPAQVPPTHVPPTQVPPTQVPPTQVPPTQVPPTQAYPPQGFPPAQPPPLNQPPAAQPPAQQGWDQPTQAMGRIEPEPTQAFTPEPTQALVPAAIRFPGEEPTSAIDSLFGDDAFREYEDGLGPDPSNAPFANRGKSKELVAVGGGDGEPPPPRHLGPLQKALIGVGSGLLGIIVLIALFLLGTRLPDLLGPAPAVATPTPTPTPTATALPIGPVPAGETYDWDELLGGECLDPYVDAWEEEYTVVDCLEPHAAQMVYRAWFPNPEADPLDPTIPTTVRPGSSDYPGAEELQAQITILCSAPGVVDLAAAGIYADAQIQGAYPATEEQWDADPSYYCFVSRSSGEPLLASVAVPRAPVQPAPPG
jgi:hypothetical protein